MKKCRKTNNWSYALNYLLRSVRNPDFLPIWETMTLTTKCNLSCGYCYFAQDGSISQEMDLKLAKEIISWLHKQGCRGIALFGGEPTLLGDNLIEIVRFAAEKRMYVYFSTNGFLLARDRYFLEEICKNGASVIAYAVDCEVEPIDGMPKKITYQLLENLNLMRKKYKIKPQLNTVITKANISELYCLTGIARLYKMPITSRLFSAQLLNRAIRGHYNPQLFTFDTDESLTELDRLIAYMIEFKKETHLILDPYESLLRIPKIARGIKVPFDCSGGKYTLSFGTQGQIYSCVDEIIKGPRFHRDLTSHQIFDKNILNQEIKKCSALCTACAEQQTTYSLKHPFKFIFNFP